MREVLQRNRSRHGRGMMRRWVCKTTNWMLVPSHFDFILYPLQGQSWVLWLDWNKLAQRGKVRMLVGWQMGRVKYKMFTGDKWREGLIRDWQMLHCACMNQRWRNAADWVVLSTEHY